MKISIQTLSYTLFPVIRFFLEVILERIKLVAPLFLSFRYFFFHVFGCFLALMVYIDTVLECLVLLLGNFAVF